MTADDVKAWRTQTKRHEEHYADEVLGAEARRFWEVYGDKPERRKFWMGAGTEGWVRDWLAGGWVAHATVHRIPVIGHAVAVLEARDEGVLLMDPIYGHVVEPWDWFLGIGPGKHDCHHIGAWYR